MIVVGLLLDCDGTLHAHLFFAELFAGCFSIPGTYFGGIYCYHALQCPMEAIHGRPSLWHNIVSGGTIGFLGVASGRFGVPFVSVEMFRYRYGISPPVAAFGIYGTISGVLAGALGGKSF